MFSRDDKKRLALAVFEREIESGPRINQMQVETATTIKEKNPRKKRLKKSTDQDESNVSSSSSSSTSTSSYIDPIQERDFVSRDFDHLTINEHMRFMPNSNKIGHAVLVKNAKGEEIAYQYALPDGENEETPKVRPLVNIESIDRFGMRRYRARTPDNNTIMYAKRYIDAEFQDKTKTDATAQALRIACFSPSAKEPFWGGKDKSTPLFSETIKKSTKKDLKKELSEIGVHTKGGNELVVEGQSVKERDNIKYRNPDQNTVMGESAKDAYEHFMEAMTSELHPDMKKRLKRSVEANLRDAFYSNYRPEWLHAEGYGLTPMSKDPQRTDNLGAAPKWTNTEMMVLERIAKWFALNRPNSFIKIKPHFEMLLDSELIKDIKFEVTIEEKNRFLRLLQTIDPFKEYPLFRKASDIAQGTAIAYNIIQDNPPAREQRVLNGTVNSSSSSSSTERTAVTTAAPTLSSAPLSLSLLSSGRTSTAFSAVSSGIFSAKRNLPADAIAKLPKKENR